MTVQKGRARVAAGAAIAGGRCDTFRANPRAAMTARTLRAVKSVRTSMRASAIRAPLRRGCGAIAATQRAHAARRMPVRLPDAAYRLDPHA
ncbi:hypothetical protein KTD18_00275 [Burkholderia multivorans]|uniref:hypothetical protein n=1 Tax=Burkholderia multivorans TaxID=87883 RepID=UPI001C224432|nr:hypothetical protein [Burkholderia multivorans]MBU9289961.1 hypothetical protein [Burkholderia multivorans]